jgi:hypothetical protein
VAPPANAQEDPSLVGEWSDVEQWPVVAVHALMLPTGQVMFWAYDETAEFHLWDPADGLITQAANPLQNIFCSGHSFLPDGRLLISGGHIRNNVGLDTANIYDPYTDSWSVVPDMEGGRWYPGSMTLENGDVLVTSGDDNHNVNQLPQVFELTTMDWRDLVDAELSLPLYPRQFLGPDGRAFFATTTSRYLDTSGTGTWSDVADRLNSGRDNYGSAVMYEAGKVLWTGGGDPPTASCETIDLHDPAPAWEQTGAMAQPRRQNNVTLLPDATVLATGGSSSPGFDDETGAVLTAELWDPQSGTWTTMAAYQQYRGYHSTALLLPDGRVLSAGGDNQPNAEVFSPPYLFAGPRPTIDSAPASVEYGETFGVGTPDAADILDVNMLRLGTTTHAHNFDQWFCPLSFSTGAAPDQLDVESPILPTDCPPGPYMLFVLDGAGVPSVAEIILLGANPTLSAALTGAFVGFAACLNLTTGDSAIATVNPDDASWDCVAAGLGFTAGDSVAAIGIGVVPGADPVGGSVIGMTPIAALCINLTAPQQTTVPIPPGQFSFDCETGVLTLDPGDRFRVIVFGTAE